MKTFIFTVFGSLFIAFILFAAHAIAMGIIFLVIAAAAVYFIYVQVRKETEDDEIHEAALRQAREENRRVKK